MILSQSIAEQHGRLRAHQAVRSAGQGPCQLVAWERTGDVKTVPHEWAREEVRGQGWQFL